MAAPRQVLRGTHTHVLGWQRGARSVGPRRWSLYYQGVWCTARVPRSSRAISRVMADTCVCVCVYPTLLLPLWTASIVTSTSRRLRLATWLQPIRWWIICCGYEWILTEAQSQSPNWTLKESLNTAPGYRFACYCMLLQPWVCKV